MSRSDRFDRADYDSRYSPGTPSRSDRASSSTPNPVWPVERPEIGQSVLRNRDGRGRPHRGVDLFVPAGSVVKAMRGGTVRRVVDGRGSTDEHRRRAGLFVDIAGRDGRVYRYLHMGSVRVRAGQQVKAGAAIGTVADAHTSGTGAKPHLHLEIRASDWKDGDYGPALDPLSLLKKV